MFFVFLLQGGIYIFELFNLYACSGICLLFITFFQSLAIGWVYKADRYFEDVKTMIGYYPSRYFKWCYCLFTPLLTMVSLQIVGVCKISQFVAHTSLRVNSSLWQRKKLDKKSEN